MRFYEVKDGADAEKRLPQPPVDTQGELQAVPYSSYKPRCLPDYPLCVLVYGFRPSVPPSLCHNSGVLCCLHWSRSRVFESAI